MEIIRKVYFNLLYDIKYLEKLIKIAYNIIIELTMRL